MFGLFTMNNFAATLIVITIAAMLLALVNVWFPDLFTGETRYKIFWTFGIIAVGAAIISGVMHYLDK